MIREFYEYDEDGQMINSNGIQIKNGKYIIKKPNI